MTCLALNSKQKDAFECGMRSSVVDVNRSGSLAMSPLLAGNQTSSVFGLSSRPLQLKTDDLIRETANSLQVTRSFLRLRTSWLSGPPTSAPGVTSIGWIKSVFPWGHPAGAMAKHGSSLHACMYHSIAFATRPYAQWCLRGVDLFGRRAKSTTT